MGTEYETRVILNMMVTSLKNRRKNANETNVQKEIDEIIEEIEAVRDGRTTNMK